MPGETKHPPSEREDRRGFDRRSPIQTHVDRDHQDLIGFLAARSFRPAPVLSLEKRLE